MLSERLELFSELVPLTPDDLPGYAGALFDVARRHPEHLRLHAWQQLERPEITAEQRASFLSKAAALDAVYRFDDERGSATTLYMLVLALVTSSATPFGSAAADEATIARHRAAVVSAVRATVDAITTRRTQTADVA